MNAQILELQKTLDTVLHPHQGPLTEAQKSTISRLINREISELQTAADDVEHALHGGNFFIVEWIKPEDQESMGMSAPSTEKQFTDYVSADQFAKKLTKCNDLTVYLMPVEHGTYKRLAQWVYSAGKQQYFEQ
jgi:hypothetical protein